MALLAHRDVVVAAPALVREGLHVILVPLGSALSPCLYALSLVLEKRRELQLDRLVKRLRARELARKHND